MCENRKGIVIGMTGLYVSLGALGVLVLLFLLWLFLIAPGKSDPEIERYKTVKYAHRGLHGELNGAFAAENSITAFRRAVEMGFGIELDVRLAKDGEVVVFHDDTLDRVAGVSGRPEDFTSEELSKLSLLGTGDGVPTFREVLQLIDGRVPLLIELKETGLDHGVTEKTVEMLRGYKGNYIIESFNPLSLGVVRKKSPVVLRGFLSDKLTAKPEFRTLKYAIVQNCVLNFKARPAFIAVHKNRIGMFPIPVIRKLFGTPCIAWTICSREEEKAAYRAGFSGIIFENYIPDTEDKA